MYSETTHLAPPPAPPRSASLYVYDTAILYVYDTAILATDLISQISSL